MRVVIAPDSFTGTLTAAQAAEAIAEGWHRAAPYDDLELVPLSDGGAGFLDVLASGLPDAEMVVVTVEGPLGRPVPAELVLHDVGGLRTAYLESATACGLGLIAAQDRDPTTTSTYGVGQLVEAALAEGAVRVVVGLGGTGTNDAGAGLLAALGAGDRARLGRGGLPLGAVEEADLAGLPSVVERLRGVDLVVATDVDAPLLGLQGATALFSAEKGATDDQQLLLENSLGHFCERVRRVVPGRLDLLTGGQTRLDKEPGAGAAGGLGFALLVLGGRRVSGIDAVADALGLTARIAAADLVITGEGRFDWQSLHESVVCGVSHRALEHGVPTVLIAGEVLIGRREGMSLGLSGTYAVADRPDEVALSMADPYAMLADRAARVARTWSPAR